MLRQVEAGLDALSGALAAGYDDFKTVRTDKSLANLRKSKKFTSLINRYDEPLINEGAIKCGLHPHTCSGYRAQPSAQYRTGVACVKMHYLST